MLKRTPLKRNTPLRAKAPLKPTKGLNRLSERRVCELNGEEQERIALCLRCGGMPQISVRTVRASGKEMKLATVTCIGGVCELCGLPAGNERMSPHEDPPRSRGGHVSLAESKMCHWRCHQKAQHSSPMWSKKE